MFEMEGIYLRNRLFQIVEIAEENDRASSVYDIFMIITIIVSIIPLAIKNPSVIWDYIDVVSAIIFIVDYIFRLVTADYKIGKGRKSFLIYPFTPMALVDLISILPSLAIVRGGYRLLKIVRLIRTLRVFRVFKTFRYSKNIAIIMNVFKKQKDSLTVVGVFALGYIVISALIIFNIEPDTFDTFFDAIYWATVSLTTVGYGDIYPVSGAGKIITMISALFGIAIVALPAGIITAGYMNELNNDKNDMELKK